MIQRRVISIKFGKHWPIIANFVCAARRFEATEFMIAQENKLEQKSANNIFLKTVE